MVELLGPDEARNLRCPEDLRARTRVGRLEQTVGIALAKS